MEKIIYETLNEIGVPFFAQGREYIETAVKIILERGKIGITTELYPRIAEIYGVKPLNVERVMRHSIEMTFLNGDAKTLQRIFGNAISYPKGTLSNSNFIYGVVKYIQVYKQGEL